MKDQFDIFQTSFAPMKLPAVTLDDDFTTVLDYSCIVEYLAFCNTHTVAVTVTVQDGAGKSLCSALSIEPSGTEVIKIPEGGLYFDQGLKWKASVAAKVDGWVRVRRA
jgi:hypothetical protein